MITFERLESQLLLWLDSFVPHLLYFVGEDHLGFRRTVNTVGLNTDNNPTLGLEEHVRVQTDNTRLIGLGNIGKNGVNHGHEHTVAERVSGILDNGNDIRAVSRHANQVTTRAMREFNSVDVASGSNNISDMADRGTASGTQVQDLSARAHVQLIETTEHTSCKLATERVPDTVFRLSDSTILSSWRVHRNALLAVDGFSGSQVLGNEQVFFAAASDEDTGVTVGFLDGECRSTS